MKSLSKVSTVKRFSSTLPFTSTFGPPVTLVDKQSVTFSFAGKNSGLMKLNTPCTLLHTLHYLPVIKSLGKHAMPRRKIGSDTSCKLSPEETICMKCQILFSKKKYEKKKKKKKKNSKCRLLKILPSMQSVHSAIEIMTTAPEKACKWKLFCSCINEKCRCGRPER